MLNKILGGKVRDKHGKYGIRKYRRKEVHGRKGYRDVKGTTLEDGPGAGMLNRILGGEVRACVARHKQNNNRCGEISRSKSSKDEGLNFSYDN